MELETRVTKVVVAPKGEPIYSERATTIYIDDEAGGEFICVYQSTPKEGIGRIEFDPREWPEIRKQIDMMVKQCRDA